MISAQKTPLRIFFSKHKLSIFTLISFLFIINLCAAYFISQERYIHSWDTLNYWAKVIYMHDGFIKNPLYSIKSLIYSIREDDYNDFPAFLLLPFYFLFGDGRVSYILSIVNIYAFPAVITFLLLHNKFCHIIGYTSKFRPLIPLGILLFLPNFWLPVMSGFVDVGGVILINIILLLSLNRPFAEQNKRDLLFIAILIPMLMLFRRWYAYWGLSFYLALIIQIGLIEIFKRPFVLSNTVKIIIKILIQMSISAIFLFIVAPTFAHRAISTNYADIYSAYKQSTSLLQSFLHVLGRFGIFYLFLFIFGAINSILDKRTRRFSIFLILQMFIIFCSFSKTQDFDSHQLYLLIPTIFIFSSLFITKLVVNNYPYKHLLMAMISLMLVLNFLPAFSTKDFTYRKNLKWLFTNIQHPPFVRNDIGEFDKIFEVLSNQLTDPKDRVYVLASSAVINSNILNCAYLSLHRYKNICIKILPTHDIDKRDGFPQELLNVKYVIVANPIQYTERPQDQRIVGIPAALFLSHQGIGASFERLPYEFNMLNNVNVYIYKKVKPINDSDLDALSQALKNYYPDKKNIYEYQKN